METLVQIGLSNAVVALVLALLALLVGATVRKPALTHGLWLLVLVKLVTPPLLTIPVGWSPPAPPLPKIEDLLQAVPVPVEPEVIWVEGEWIEWPAEEAMAPPVPAMLPLLASLPEIPEPVPPSGWWAVVFAVWLTGAMVWFGLAFIRVRRFACLLKSARPAPAWLCDQVAALAKTLGRVRMPGVWLVPGRVPPMIWKPFHPQLLLPVELWESLTPEQRETLLVHELAHLRRRDHWVRAVELVVLGLYWWHPIVWIACRQLREAEEQCCDAWVVSTLSGSGRTYAEAILETLDFLAESRTPAPLLASGVGQVSDLKRRLTMILQGTTPRSLTWRSAIGLLTVAALLLPALPVWGQDKNDNATLIKQLREQITELEKKLGQPGKEPIKVAIKVDAEKVDPDMLKKAEAELKEVQAVLEKKAAEMQEVARKVAEATERVVKAGGKVEAPKIIRLELPGLGAGAFKVEPFPGGKAEILILRKMEGMPAEGVRWDFDWVPGGNVRGQYYPMQPRQPVYPMQPGQPVYPMQPGQPGRNVEVRPNLNPNPRANPQPNPGQNQNQNQGGGDRRIDNLERQLERVLQELQEMKRNQPQQRPGPGGPGGPGTGPGGPGGPGTGPSSGPGGRPGGVSFDRPIEVEIINRVQR